MKKRITIILGIIALSVAAYFIFNQPTKDSVTIKKTHMNTESGETTPVINIEENRKIPIETEFPPTMNEIDVENAIHAMSHQKVRAEDKWGFLPMTQERIELLIKVVEKNKSKYGENAEVYLNILKRWSNNDFSSVDHDHNLIWDIQGGTIGKATGVLTIEQEKEFIKKHYKTNE